MFKNTCFKRMKLRALLLFLVIINNVTFSVMKVYILCLNIKTPPFEAQWVQETFYGQNCTKYSC